MPDISFSSQVGTGSRLHRCSACYVLCWAISLPHQCSLVWKQTVNTNDASWWQVGQHQL